MEEKINLSISDGDAFFAHQASINFNPSMMFVDFKNITPRVDERSATQPTIVLKHNVVMLEPYHALLFKNLLDKVVADYEKQFGKIEKPHAILEAEKLAKKRSGVIQAKTNTDIPNYFG